MARAYPLRALGIWLLLRLFIAYGTGAVEPLSFELLAIFVAVISLVTWIDMRRRREMLILGNLGVAWQLPIVLACLTCVFLEIALRVVT